MAHPASIRISVAFGAAMLWSGIAAADRPLIDHLNNHLEGSIGAEHLSYSELNNGLNPQISADGDLDTESGTLLSSGLVGSWQGKLWFIDKLRADLGIHLSSGGVTYNGYLQDLQTGALTPLQVSTDETISDYQFRAGKGFSLWGTQHDLLTPYAGIGLTAWHRSLTGPGGYTEQYRHKYWKLGGQYQLVLVRNLVLNLDASYGHMVSPRMNSSDLPNTFELGSTSIQNYTLGLRYMTSHEAYVGLDTYWMHYGYDQSPTYSVDIDGATGTVLEPTSRTTRDGVVFVFGYAYR